MDAPTTPVTTPTTSTPAATPSAPPSGGPGTGGMANLQERIAATLMAEPTQAPAQEPSQTPAQTPPPAVATPEPEQTATEPVTEPEPEEFSFSDEKQPEPAAEEPAKTEEEPEEFTQPQMKEILRTERGRRMLRDFHIMQELEKPPDEGGLGRVPSVEEIKEAVDYSSQMAMMHHEFQSGQPEQAQNFVKYWFEVPEGQNPSQGQIANAALMAQNLQQTNPTLFTIAARPFQRAYLEELYQRGMASQDKDDRLWFLNAARTIEYDLNLTLPQNHPMHGKVRDLPADIVEKGQQVDPAAQLRQQLEARDRADAEARQQSQQQRIQQFETGMTRSIQSGIWNDVQDALKVVKDGLKPKVYGSVVRQYAGEAWTKMQASLASPVGRQFIMARQRAAASNDPQDVEAALTAAKNLVRPIIRSLRKQYLEDAGAGIVSRSQERHATLSEAAAKTGATSVGQPVAPSGSQQPARLPGESYSESIDRRVRAVMVQ